MVLKNAEALPTVKLATVGNRLVVRQRGSGLPPVPTKPTRFQAGACRLRILFLGIATTAAAAPTASKASVPGSGTGATAAELSATGAGTTGAKNAPEVPT